MRIFIDCEWNSYQGELISVALCTENGLKFYEVLPAPENIDQWVSENVMPILGKDSISYKEVQEKLQDFLMSFESVHIVADWPEDIERFCKLLITGPGTRINTPPLTMEILRVDSISKLPHNALEDAKGLMNFVKEFELSRIKNAIMRF